MNRGVFFRIKFVTHVGDTFRTIDMTNPYASPATHPVPAERAVRYCKLALACVVAASVDVTMIALSSISNASFFGYLPDAVGLVVGTAMMVCLCCMAWLECLGSEGSLHRTRWIAVPVALLSVFALFRFGMLFDSTLMAIRTFPTLVISPVPPLIALYYVAKVFKR